MLIYGIARRSLSYDPATGSIPSYNFGQRQIRLSRRQYVDEHFKTKGRDEEKGSIVL